MTDETSETRQKQDDAMAILTDSAEGWLDGIPQQDKARWLQELAAWATERAQQEG